MIKRMMFRIVPLVLLTLMFTGCASDKDKKLIEAAGRGDVALVGQLIDQGASIDAVALDDWTPLTRAATEGHLDVVRLLLAKGADVNKPIGDISPLFFAANYGHTPIVKVLLAHGALLNLPQANREAFVARLKAHNDPELMRILLEQF